MKKKYFNYIFLLTAISCFSVITGLWLLSHSLIRWEYEHESAWKRRVCLLHAWTWNGAPQQAVQIDSAGGRAAIRSITPSFLLPAGKTIKLSVTQEAWQILDDQGRRDIQKPGALIRVALRNKSGHATISDFGLNASNEDAVQGYLDIPMVLPAGAISLSITVVPILNGKVDESAHTFVRMTLPDNPLAILGLPVKHAGRLLVIAGLVINIAVFTRFLIKNGPCMSARRAVVILMPRFRLSALAFFLMFLAAVSGLILITYIPRSDIRKNIKSAYDRGMLNVSWSHHREVVEGIDTFSDAAIANFALDKNPNRLLNALSPRYSTPGGRPGWMPEQDLLSWVSEPAQMQPLGGTNRYWFGHMALSKPLLWVFGVRGAREILFCLIILGALASVRATQKHAPGLTPQVWCLCAGLFTCSGVFLFGKLWVQNPVYLAPWGVTLCCLFFYKHTKASVYRSVLPVMLGAASNFVENATGVVLVSLSTYVVVDYFYHVRERKAGRCLALLNASGQVLRFVAAFTFFIILKLALLSAIIGTDSTFGAFARAVAQRTGVAGQLNPWLIFEAVVGSARSMVFWDAFFTPSLILFSLAGGLAVLLGAMLWLSRGDSKGRMALDYVVLGVPLVLTACWYLLFSNHTFVHSFIMARFVFLPMAFFACSMVLILQEFIKYRTRCVSSEPSAIGDGANG
jgi:hypothetical protein